MLRNMEKIWIGFVSRMKLLISDERERRENTQNSVEIDEILETLELSVVVERASNWEIAESHVKWCENKQELYGLCAMVIERVYAVSID